MTDEREMTERAREALEILNKFLGPLDWEGAADIFGAKAAARIDDYQRLHQADQDRIAYLGIGLDESQSRLAQVKKERDEALAEVTRLKAQNAELVEALRALERVSPPGYYRIEAGELLCRIDAENAAPAVGAGGEVVLAGAAGPNSREHGYFGGDLPEPSAPKRPALWSWVRRLKDGKRVQVTGYHEGATWFSVSDGIEVGACRSWDKGITWDDIPAEPRRPKVGDVVRIPGGGLKPVIYRSVRSEDFETGGGYSLRDEDHGITWWFEDERPTS